MSPDSMHAIGAHHLTLQFQENLNAPIAISWVLRREKSLRKYPLHTMLVINDCSMIDGIAFLGGFVNEDMQLLSIEGTDQI
jgi:hypothetical protein